jgi:sarcosine oxidase subunit alpha
VGAVPGLVAAGAAGAFSTHAALAGGAAAAVAALCDSGIASAAPVLPQAEDAATRIAAHRRVRDARGRAWLYFQSDVTVKDVALAAKENFASVEHIKRYTILGMTTEQG